MMFQYTLYSNELQLKKTLRRFFHHGKFVSCHDVIKRCRCFQTTYYNPHKYSDECKHYSKSSNVMCNFDLCFARRFYG